MITPLHARISSLLLLFSLASALAAEELNQPSPLMTPEVAIGGAEVVSVPYSGDTPFSGATTGDSAFSLNEAEALALENNPSLAVLAARQRAAMGERLQVGLPPNPTVGYSAAEVGNEGHAGQQGISVGQKFIRGGKLQLNRAIADAEVQRIEQQRQSQRQRVLTDVRVAYFAVHLAQRRVEVGTQLVKISEKAVKTAQQLVDAKEGKTTDLLQAEIESSRTTIDLQQARNLLQQTWQQLANVIGIPGLVAAQVSADEEGLKQQLDWETALQELLDHSPEIAEAWAKVQRAERALQRARVEPVKDVTTQFTVQHDTATNYVVTGVSISVPVPIWNRNQGGIGKAEGELLAARRSIPLLELRIAQQLAATFQQFQTARARVEMYESSILPKAKRTMALVSEGYQAGETGFLESLTAQRTYFQATLQHLIALGELNRSVHLIDGLMLSGSLDALN